MNHEPKDESLSEGAEPALEQNVERLLRSASQPPRMRDEAKARVLAELLTRQAKMKAPTVNEPAAPRLPSIARRRFVTPARALGVAAVLAMAAGVAVYLRPQPQQHAVTTFENAGPGPREIALSDGSKAILDEGAVLIEKAPRDVELVKGQVVFDVAKKAAAFLVETKQGKASALGTRFWMRAGEAGAEVAVAKGRVELASTGGAKVTIGAGEEGVLTGSAPPKANAAKRVSHYFDFARPTDAEDPSDAPRRAGTLTARDPRWGGKAQPLELRSFTIDVRVENGFAQTTIDQTFFNPRSRQLEGTYAFPLPEGAALSRLAMYVDGKRMEGAMVDRSRGRDIYEGIVEQRRDPALLEWMSGNTFRMRVFPLPPKTDKRIFVSYTQPLEHLYGAERLVVPIPKVDQHARTAKFEVRVVGGASQPIASPSHTVTARDDGPDRIVSFEASDYALGQDLVLTLGAASDDKPRSFDPTEGKDRFVMTRFEPDVRAIAAAQGVAPDAGGGRSIAIVFDVSASRSAEDLTAQAKLVDGLLDSFDEEDRVSVITFGHDAEAMPGGPKPAREIDRAAVGKFLRARGEGLGDSRIAVGLDAAMRELGAGAGEREIFYVGDGFEVDASAPESEARAQALAKILDGRAKFIGIGVGDSVDKKLLDAVANATGGIATVVGEDEDMRHRAFDLVSATYTPCIRGLAAKVLDADGKLVPSAVAALASLRACDGERIEVVARAPKTGPAPATIRIEGSVEGKAWQKELSLSGAASGAAYLPRVFAERRVAALLADEPPGPGRAESPNAAEITALATRYFLVTPFTSLLVLENDAMYKQFGVEKKKPEGWAVYDAPESIEVHTEPLAGGGDWDILDRDPKPLFYSYDEGIGLGSIGTIGHGGGPARGMGFGSGRGRLGGRHMERPMQPTESGDPVAARLQSRVSTSDLAQDITVLRRPAASASGSPLALSGAGEGGGGFGFGRATLTKSAEAPRATDEAFRADQAYAGAALAQYQYSSERGLLDLTSFAPAMFTLEVDRVGDYLAAIRRVGVALPDDAKALGSKSRLAATGDFVSSRGRAVSVDREVTLTQRLPNGLGQIDTLDGTKLVTRYDELGLSTKRDVGAGSAFWLATELPFVMPPMEALEGLDVAVIGGRTLRVRAPEPSAGSSAPDVPEILWTFDDAGRVTSLRIGTEPAITIAYEGDTIAVTRPGEAPELFKKQSGLARPSPAKDLVEIAMPLSSPRRWEEIIGRDPHGRDAIDARRQLLATYAALEDVSKAREQIEALHRERAGLSRGEVVLAGSVARGDDKLLSALPDVDPVRAYLSASTPDALARLSDKQGSTLIGLVSLYRSILLDTETSSTKNVKKKIDQLATRFPEATFFRYAAVRLSAERVRWTDDKLALSYWDTLTGDRELGFIADRQSVDIMMGLGKRKEASERAVRAFEGAIDNGTGLQLDWQMRYAVTEGRGQVGLDVLIARWRNAVATRGNADQVLGLVRTFVDPYGGQPQPGFDLGAVLRRLDAAPDTEDEHRLKVASLLVAGRRLPEAKTVLASMLTRDDVDLRALELSANIAEQEGDLDRAAALLDRLLRETASQSMELEVVRAWYSRLLDLHLRRAGLGSGNADAKVSEALAVAARWRRDDPENSDIDERCAFALFRMGRDADARRSLTSIIDRRPAEGASWSRVARVLEQQGDLEGALAAYRRASTVEPTNPTWSLSHAQALLARDKPGDRAEARALLQTIAKGKYQDRFMNVVYSAKSLLEGTP